MSPHEMSVEMPEHPFCIMVAKQRKEKGISLRTLCKKLGTSSRSYLAEIEKGRFAPSFDVGSAICQVLDIPVYLYIEYYKEFNMARQRAYIERSYTEWFEMIPEEVAVSMVSLSPRESSIVHSTYYNKEYSTI